MKIFKPKAGPVWRWSRFVHLLLAATVTAYGGHLWGYQGAVWMGVGMIVIGLGWEITNKLSGVGPHPYADALDFWAFVLGAALSGVGWTILA